MFGILVKLRFSSHAVGILSKLWTWSYHFESTCVSSIISMHVRCGYNKRKEIMGDDLSITLVREVGDGDPQRLKELL